MAKLTTSGVVREILTRNPEIDTNEAIRLAKAKGLRVPDEKIRHSIHNQRNPIRAKVAAGATKVAPTAARETAPSKTAAPATPAAAGDLDGVLANVARINDLITMCGIVNLHNAAEAVQACGGVDAFLRHLEVVAAIRRGESAS